MTGTPRSRQSCAFALMCSNCALRSGCCLPFDGLVRRLQAVAVLAQQLGHGLVADPDAVLREQLRGQRVRALARPPQRRLRVAARDRIDELLQRRPHLGMRDLVRSFAGAASNLDDVLGPGACASLVAPLAHRADRHAGRARHCGHAAPADRVRLGAGPQSTRALVHGRLQQAPLLANQLLRVRAHIDGRSRRRDPVDPLRAVLDADSIDSAIPGPLDSVRFLGQTEGIREKGIG